ncbi:hypothetical protein LC087_02395 [Bacillus carboniphilus]|uniref:Uncharacterized protein n=1 Tax=Bacillus carboniphilus TaxID=86663 RepID=A0ABY9JZL5_9BACI|nr:hypothetical protein [Bacillus carboniphilus]WLR43081.1 hypothetical protein LC087_02395 [Bacillus carboniphilus]
MGDIAGIVSGAATTSAVIQLARLIANDNNFWQSMILTILLTSLVASFTVGGKAICKTIAIYQSTNIIYYTGKVLYYLQVISPIPLIDAKKTKKQRELQESPSFHVSESSSFVQKQQSL